MIHVLELGLPARGHGGFAVNPEEFTHVLRRVLNEGRG